MNCKVCGGKLYCKGFCRKCYCRQYYSGNIQKFKEDSKKYYAKHKEEVIRRTAKWRLNNPDARKKEYQNNKDTIKERANEWYKRNHQRAVDRNRQWRHNNIERNRELQKRYDNNHKIEIRERGRIYRLNNKDKIKERGRIYRLNNKEQIELRAHIRRMRDPERTKMLRRRENFKRRTKLKELNCSLEVPIELQRKIIDRDEICVYCSGRTYVKDEIGYTKKNERTIDHIIAIDNNGNNNPNNLVLACNSCNSSKDNNDVFEWCKNKGINVPNIVIELLNRQKQQIKLEVLI